MSDVSQHPAIELRHITKTFVTRDDKVVFAVADFTLDIAAGEFVTILGPSGCGKSTVLNILARIESASSGGALIRGRALDAAWLDVGYVFQDDTVLPWRNVVDNIALGLLIRGIGEAERMRRVRDLIETMSLQGFESAYPSELSGGMRKRVALATALAFDPPILLMDEPFGALDAQTRVVLQQELMDIWLRTRKTVVFVTHDIHEAIILADRVVVMTKRPGTIKSVWPVDLPRPRDPDSIGEFPAYQSLIRQLGHELRPEVTA